MEIEVGTYALHLCTHKYVYIREYVRMYCIVYYVN